MLFSTLRVAFQITPVSSRITATVTTTTLTNRASGFGMKRSMNPVSQPRDAAQSAGDLKDQQPHHDRDQDDQRTMAAGHGRHAEQHPDLVLPHHTQDHEQDHQHRRDHGEHPPGDAGAPPAPVHREPEFDHHPLQQDAEAVPGDDAEPGDHPLVEPGPRDQRGGQ